MLLAILVAACVASHAVASPDIEPLPGKIYYDLEDAQNLFKEHVKVYLRKYNVEEYNKRFEIFKENLKIINELNVEFPQTVFRVNHFSDLIPEEKQKYFGFKPPSHSLKRQEKKFTLNVGSNPAPESFDWREHGAVTPVKNQWNCGSCYIFSAIGNIEGQYAIKHKKLVSFSEQQCLDCLPNTTCAGGFMTDVYTKLTKRVGCMPDKDYPYLADDEQNCHEYVDQVVAKVTGGEILNFSNADEMAQMVYEIGPLSVALDARDLQYYWMGILQPGKCSSNPDRANHAVLIVGYGVSNIEGQYAIKHKKLVSLSEQQCMDCLPDSGCYGGMPILVMTNLTKRAGLMAYEDYPYLAIDHQPCQEKSDEIVAKVTRAEVLNIQNAEHLKQKLLEIGPLSVAVDASDFHSYVGGVLSPYACRSELRSLDHAVLLVGYGEDNGDKYWTLKNSWGEHHGESGYVRLRRGVNACGVENTEFIITAHVE